MTKQAYDMSAKEITDAVLLLCDISSDKQMISTMKELLDIIVKLKEENRALEDTIHAIVEDHPELGPQ